MQNPQSSPEFDYHWYANPSMISNHGPKGPGGWFFQGRAVLETKINTGDIIANSVLGTCRAGASEFTREIHEWCTETFGAEWNRWHLKMIVHQHTTQYARATERTNTVTIEAYFVEKADFALFRLRY